MYFCFFASLQEDHTAQLSQWQAVRPGMIDFEPGAALLWKLKGQGNANAVFAYTGTDSYKAKHVLRVRKEKLPGDSQLKTSDALEELEKDIWGGVIIDWTSDAIAQQQYEDKVLKSLLGSQCTHQGQSVHLPLQFAAALSQQQNVHLSQQAWLVQDHTVFQQDPAPDSGHQSCASVSATSTICLELKPKCGFLPTSPCIHPDHSIKLRVPRFQLHQQLKLAQGKVKRRSAYNPLALFSGDVLNMQQALRDLFDCPQNNLRLFIDGEPVAPEACKVRLAEVSIPYGGPAKLIKTFALILQQTGVLQKVLNAQQLDVHDIEGIKVLLDDLLAKDCKLSQGNHSKHSGTGHASRDLDAPAASGSVVHIPPQREQMYAVDELTGLDKAAALGVMRGYLTAATAKDLSILMTLRKAHHPSVAAQSGNAIDGPDFLTKGNGLQARRQTDDGFTLQYKIALVDLDRKPLEKVYAHWKLDRDIVQKTLATGKGSCACLDKDVRASD